MNRTSFRVAAVLVILAGGDLVLAAFGRNGRTGDILASEQIRILKQTKEQREYTKAGLQPVDKIVLETLSPPIFRPSFLSFDDSGNIFILESSDYRIHKFSPNKDRRYDHSVFGKGKGQGPGEFSHVFDMKISRNKIYFVDNGTGSVEVYSTDGSYLNRLTPKGGKTPTKIVKTKRGLIVEPRYSGGEIFQVWDDEGKILSSFGEYFDPSVPIDSIYNDNTLSEAFFDESFFYLPYYLGYVVLYKDEVLALAKETIDGPGKKPRLITETVNGLPTTWIEESYETATQGVVFGEYILIKAIDLKKEIAYWDIYRLRDFEYLASIKDPPALRAMAVHGSLLAGFNDEELKFYDLNDVLEEIKLIK